MLQEKSPADEQRHKDKLEYMKKWRKRQKQGTPKRLHWSQTPEGRLRISAGLKKAYREGRHPGSHGGRPAVAVPASDADPARVSMAQYTLARRLKKLLVRRIASDGDIGELETFALLLVQQILG